MISKLIKHIYFILVIFLISCGRVRSTSENSNMLGFNRALNLTLKTNKSYLLRKVRILRPFVYKKNHHLTYEEEYIKNIKKKNELPLKELIINNKNWVNSLKNKNTEYFKDLSSKTKPKYLIFTCIDGRIPIEKCLGIKSGEASICRTISNIVPITDLHYLATLEFAIKIQEVSNIIICGHYGCGGIKSAFDINNCSLTYNWLKHIRNIDFLYRNLLDKQESEEKRHNLLCLLNVMEQVRNISYSSPIQEAWESNKALSVHGMIYNTQTGIVGDVGINISSQKDLDDEILLSYNF